VLFQARRGMARFISKLLEDGSSNSLDITPFLKNNSIFADKQALTDDDKISFLFRR